MKTKKIAFVIDGYFGLTLYSDIKNRFEKVISFEGLVSSICTALEKRTEEKCISPANLRQYYMGTDLGTVDPVRNEYENALLLARFGARGRPLKNGREKCIDTMLYSDIKEAADSGAFDYLVLLAGDLDHITLVQDLKNLGIRTLLVYGEIMSQWGRTKTTGYSRELKETCFEAVDIFDLLDNQDIFKPVNCHHSITDLMRKTEISVPEKRLITDRFLKQDSLCKGINADELLKEVVSSVNQVISEKEKLQGRKLSFAFQAQVGNQLKRSGIALPASLSEYFATYPHVFKTGTHPYTQALTVSIR